jgi:pimeloyl-ACP methyl ester carboxylesterase
LFGLRLGASLATLAAQRRTDVQALIAFAPVIKVKAFLRELRALALSKSTASVPTGAVDPTIQEAAGFATTEQTRNELSKIDLLQLDGPRVPHALIFDRDDLTADDSWARHLQEKGSNVESRRLNRYVQMMHDAHQSRVPSDSIDSALAWLSELPISAKSEREPVAAIPFDANAKFTLASAGSTNGVQESALFIDRVHPLFAVVSEPETAQTNGTKPVLILLNSGTIHHIGPGRLYVSLARQCAARGMSVLRLDLSGVGESPVRTGEEENRAYSSAAQQDVAQAIRFASERLGATDIHLVGLCSGAYHGLKAAVRGLPLRSVVAINPLTFFWKEGMPLDFADFQVISETSRYRRTALEPAAWLKLLRGRVDVRVAGKIFIKRLGVLISNACREGARILHIPLREDLASELRRVARQNIDLFFVFSSSDPGLSMLREQGGRAVTQLSRKDALRIAVIQGADHTFTSYWNRNELTGVLLAHFDRHIGFAARSHQSD